MKKSVAILGSTGSIGTQALDVCDHLGFSVCALTAQRQVERMEIQARRYHPRVVALFDEEAARTLRVRLADTDIRVLSGETGITEAAAIPEADIVLSATVGVAGLAPTLSAIQAGHPIALANKETLVCAGELVMGEARRKGVPILPVDSEHAAIFQCLQGEDPERVSRIHLTASGGPFYGKSASELKTVTVQEALRHPQWSMGAKITIDSATLMNKGLECIEAMHLFSVPMETIEVLIHPQSIIHSMVRFVDGSVMAQLGVADMRLPIQYALTYPERGASLTPPPVFLNLPPLTFGQPDNEAFPCLSLARASAETGGTAPVILNAANEVAVADFLAGRGGFMDIPRRVSQALSHLPVWAADSLEAVKAADRDTRSYLAAQGV